MVKGANPIIWLVDDEVDLVDQLADYLRLRFEVRKFNSAEETIQHMQNSEERPLAIFTDLRMGNMDGIALIEEIRKQRPEAAVVLMSGFAQRAHLTMAIDRGVDAFLDKPFTLESIDATLERVLSRQNNAIAQRMNLTKESMHLFKQVYQECDQLKSLYYEAMLLAEEKLEKFEQESGFIAEKSPQELKRLMEQSRRERSLEALEDRLRKNAELLSKMAQETEVLRLALANRDKKAG